MNECKQPLSELLRPQQLGDLTLPQPDIDRLQKMVDNDQLMNMIFYGKPGLGKTSAAEIIMTLSNTTTIMRNPAALIRDGIKLGTAFERFAIYSPPYERPYRIMLVDEADGLPPLIQASLRHLIEMSYGNCRFLFTVNDVKKIHDPLRSRMKEICFDITPAQRPGVIARLTARYKARMSELGIKFDSQRLAELVGIYYPDFRSIANQIEYEFA